jgi:hypothetical protein
MKLVKNATTGLGSQRSTCMFETFMKLVIIILVGTGNGLNHSFFSFDHITTCIFESESFHLYPTGSNCSETVLTSAQGYTIVQILATDFR